MLRYLETNTAMSHACVNAHVLQQPRLLGKRKRVSTHDYEDEIKTKIGRYAAENGPYGNSKAVAKFSEVLGWKVPESTVRNFKKAYLKEIQAGKDPEEVQLKAKSRGRPLLLGELDNIVQKYIKELRIAGGIISTLIVMAAAEGIIMHHDPMKLKEYGGPFKATKSWAASLLSRMNMVKRKGTRAAHKIPDDFEDVKKAFLVRVSDVFSKAGNPPPQLIINFDQTGCKFIPCSQWTMEAKVSKQIEIRGLDDKREMTVLYRAILVTSM